MRGLSAESEKKNRLCVLCALSAAGGESMSKDDIKCKRETGQPEL